MQNVYDTPQWQPIEQLYIGNWGSMLLVGRASPAKEDYYLAVAYRFEGKWFFDSDCKIPLDFEPTYFAMAPGYPPWQPLHLLTPEQKAAL